MDFIEDFKIWLQDDKQLQNKIVDVLSNLILFQSHL